MRINISEIARILLHFAMFGFSFYALSSLDLGKLILPVENRTVKAQLLLILMSLALGYLSAQFILAILYQF
ncbi:MAG: DUF1146 domain-containing protein [Erysipelotrichaceae bacterium]|nr:DUF1146 domain-containing protein [Erysipelotrichaceae bacterium]